MLKSIGADEARDLMLAELPAALCREEVPLSAALGRVLAEDLRAEVPMPPFDRSPLDGYALRWEDTQGASEESPAVLRILEEIPAGRAPSVTVIPGTAVKILTGAPMPPGADSVIKYELTQFDHEAVRIFAPLKPCQNVIYQGEEARQGDLLLPVGTVLTPAGIGLLAAQGRERCAVFQVPTAAVLTTGSELTGPGVPLQPGKIYDSNNAMLSALLAENGIRCVRQIRLPDDLEAIAAAIETAWQQTDLVLTTGGASVGDYDFAVAAAERVGAEVLFWKVKMKPGSCILAARRGEKALISLSGNPGAAAVCLLRVVLPYLNKLRGKADWLPEVVELPLKEPLKKKSPILRMLRGRLEIAEGKAVFAENPRQGNGMISSLQGFDLLGEVPAGSPPLPEGTMIRAYRFR